MKLKNLIEGVIFGAAKGITYKQIKEAFGEDYTEKEIKAALTEITEEYSDEKGIILIEYNNTYQFQTNPRYSDIFASILREVKEKQLSQTVLQTLAIIAYRQPITRSEIDDIRKVSSDYAIGILMKAELIEITDRKDTPGRPALYGTTDNFLKHFQLKSLKSLPDYEELMKTIQESGKFNKTGSSIYAIKDKALYEGDMEDSYFETEEEAEESFAFMKGEDMVEIESDPVTTEPNEEP